LEQFLKQIKLIFDVEKDGRLNKKRILLNFYNEVKACSSKEELISKVINIDGNYLNDFYSENEIPDKAYDVKTKLRSLFHSIYIQKFLFFSFVQNKEFVATARKEVSELLGASVFDQYEPEEQSSVTNFYIVLREAKHFQTHKKWEKFAFYTVSMAVGEGVWYCPGGGAKPTTIRRSTLYRKFEGLTSEVEFNASSVPNVPPKKSTTLVPLISPQPVKTKSKAIPATIKVEATPKRSPTAKKMAATPKKRGRPRKDSFSEDECPEESTFGPPKRRRSNFKAAPLPVIMEEEVKMFSPIQSTCAAAAVEVEGAAAVEWTDAEDMSFDEFGGFGFDFTDDPIAGHTHQTRFPF
jgi:hypothetical protein